MGTCLLGKHTSTKISERDLETSSIIIMMDLDRDQSIRANMERGGSGSSHGGRNCRGVREVEKKGV